MAGGHFLVRSALLASRETNVGRHANSTQRLLYNLNHKLVFRLSLCSSCCLVLSFSSSSFIFPCPEHCKDTDVFHFNTKIEPFKSPSEFLCTTKATLLYLTIIIMAGSSSSSCFPRIFCDTSAILQAVTPHSASMKARLKRCQVQNFSERFNISELYLLRGLQQAAQNRIQYL